MAMLLYMLTFVVPRFFLPICTSSVALVQEARSLTERATFVVVHEVPIRFAIGLADTLPGLCVYKHPSFDPPDPQRSRVESCPQDSAMTRAGY